LFLFLAVTIIAAVREIPFQVLLLSVDVPSQTVTCLSVDLAVICV